MGEIEKSLGTLAEEINAEHRAFVGTLRKTVEHGIRAGELLAAAKAECSHGTWLPWLEENFEGAPRTAQEYMRLHTHRDEIRSKYADSAHLSIGGALQEIAAPRGEVVHRSVDEEGAVVAERFEDGSSRFTIPAHPERSFPSFEDRIYAQFRDKPEFVAGQLWEVISSTTARFEDVPRENPLSEVLDAFEWRQVLALLEHKRDEQAARWVESYARAGSGTNNFDMRKKLGYVLRHNEYAEIGRLEEDIKILREAGRNYAALASGLDAAVKGEADG